ncbi:MAG: hemerythrin domain-containing protein [Asticcacaulis sp.]
MESLVRAATPEAMLSTLKSQPAHVVVTFVLERFHDVHRVELPQLITMSERVEAAHASDSDCPKGLTRLLQRIYAELEDHQMKEEVILFPMMLSDPHPNIVFPIRRMMAEHTDLDRDLAGLALLTRDFTAPEAACGTWRKLYLGLKKLANDLSLHMEIENTILFPLFMNSTVCIPESHCGHNH